MPRGVPNHAIPHLTKRTQADLRERIKEIEQQIKAMDRREKALKDLKKWLATRGLGHGDLGWMYREMAPKRADAPIKSKKPLQPPPKGNLGKIKGLDAGFIDEGKHYAPKGDREFRHAIYNARVERGLSTVALGAKLKISGSTIASWEKGRYVPGEDKRRKLVKFLGLPVGLGAAATAAMEAEHPARSSGNGAAAAT